jgi:hypothetical protein
MLEMQDDLVKMRQVSAQVIASQKQLESKFKQNQNTAVRELTLLQLCKSLNAFPFASG